MKTITEPLLVKPRLDPKPWGGNRLAHFGVEMHGADDIGEAVLTSNDAIVAQGQFAGQSIESLVAQNPDGLLGSAGSRPGTSNDFPLLIKLIDAHQNLSIQVHPTDDLAPAGMCGKTEAWYILEAAPGAVIYAGLHGDVTVEDVRKHLDYGTSIVPLIRTVPVVPGDVIFLPAGTIHALGAGIVLYEIQQQSAITYRLEDWGRDREMHIEAGMRALNPEYRPAPVKPAVRTATSHPRPAVACEYFSLEIIQIGPDEEILFGPEIGPQVFSCVSGQVEISVAHHVLTLASGSTAILFANAGPARLSSSAGGRVLRGWIGG